METGSNSRNTTRTDLSMLLECLKFQMKCPELQKQALLAIHSICEGREDHVDLLREIGGVAFVYNLSKSSIVHSDVKETALFTVGTLAEANVYCKNSLCRRETFADIAGLLMEEDIPLTQKRVSVYLLSVLVTNNKSGQTLAQTSGCLDIMLDIYRTTFPLSPVTTSRAANATQTHQLWATASSALCGCVNNPQNEEGQQICVAAFPMLKTWLQQIDLPQTEIIQPICSFIAMTVFNNSYVQEIFSASGVLDTLALSLARFTNAADTSLLSCRLSVTISKTVSACITDNASLAARLAQYDVVSCLFNLLASPHLDPEDRLSVLLTLGHCTSSSEEHQYQLVQCGGLPVVITLLTEDTSEDVRKTATFILQTCKQATMSLGEPGPTVRQSESENMGTFRNMEEFRSSARELLHRIDMLEKRQGKEAEDEQEDTGPLNSTERLDQPYHVSSALPLPLQQESNETVPASCRQMSTWQHVEALTENDFKPRTVRNMIKYETESKPFNASWNVSEQEENANPSGGLVCSACKRPTFSMSDLQSLEGGRELQTTDNQLLGSLAPVNRIVPRETRHTDGEESNYLEMAALKKKPLKAHLQHRCAGCVLPFGEVNSRTFDSLQSKCRHSCDIHSIIQEASERYRKHHRDLLLRRENQNKTVGQAAADCESISAAQPQRRWKNMKEVGWTPIRKREGKGKSQLPEDHWKGIRLTPMHRGTGRKSLTSNLTTGPRLTPLNRPQRPEAAIGIRLTPLHRGTERRSLTSNLTTGPRLTPLKRPHHPEESSGRNNCGQHAFDDGLTANSAHCSTRRERKDYSDEEIHYLLSGVKTYGFSWNTILWSYPFQPGRTNVDLAKKYRRLTQTNDNPL